MSNDLEYIPCGVSRCDWKRLYEELKPNFDNIKTNHDRMVVELENFAKVLEEGSDQGDPQVKAIISEKVRLSNDILIIRKENANLQTNNYLLKEELQITKNILSEKSEEVIDIKSKYELDDEIVERKEQLVNLEKDLSIRNLERNRIKKVNEMVRNKFSRLEEQYNKKIEDYNKQLDKIKELGKKVKKVKKNKTNQIHEERRNKFKNFFRLKRR